jgi:hypothetical protein
MSAEITEYKTAFPDELKEKLGAIIQDVLERDIADNVYINVLCDLCDALKRECAMIGMTPPLWTEQGGRSCMLSYIDNLRRDVRHTLSNQLTSLNVLTLPRNRIHNGTQYFYIPFKFSCTTERSVDLVLPDLHHMLVKLFPIIEPYLPLRRSLQKRVEHAFLTSSLSRDWIMDRVNVGHTDRDPDYVSSPFAFHDTMIRHNSSGDREYVMTTPQHRILTRETYISPHGERCFANLTLNINVFVTHRRTGRKVMMTLDHSPLVMLIELPRSMWYSTIRHPGMDMVIRPGSRTLTTLRPIQWALYESAVVPNIPRAAMWMMIDELVTHCKKKRNVDEYLGELDESVPDGISWNHLKNILPRRQCDIIMNLSQTPKLSELRQLPPTIVVTETIRASRRGRDRLHLSTPFLKNNRWCIECTNDGTRWTHSLLYDFVVASVVMRTFVDALIVSRVLDAHPVYDVPYITEESMHDTFY